MYKKAYKTTIAITIVCCSATGFAQNQLAFPTAEGYGKYTVGGRGGSVCEVTNLNDSGPGSLRAAVEASGSRTVVFQVSGTIDLKKDLRVTKPNITIAGQSAPGDGICLKGSLAVSADNVIIRYIRCRQDTAVYSQGDAIGGRFQHDIIVDHVSASWSGDETMSFYHNTNVTIQWCMITEACVKFVNGKNTGHQFGGIWGNNYGTYHHNLIADNVSRNPRWASGCGYNDYRNNVVYNWKYKSSYGGEAGQPKDGQFDFSTINIVANYYKPGPATKNAVRSEIADPSARSDSDRGSWYVAGNFVDGNPEVTADNWKGVKGNSYIKLDAPWNAIPINQQAPAEAYAAVLAQVGCSKPRRDSADAAILRDVAAGTATRGDEGILTHPTDVGAWPDLKSTAAPADTDHDGMPDDWEIKQGLNPNNAADRNRVAADGYTMLEKYLNSLE
jgi:hypothetical protein